MEEPSSSSANYYQYIDPINTDDLQSFEFVRCCANDHDFQLKMEEPSSLKMEEPSSSSTNYYQYIDPSNTDDLQISEDLPCVVNDHDFLLSMEEFLAEFQKGLEFDKQASISAPPPTTPTPPPTTPTPTTPPTTTEKSKEDNIPLETKKMKKKVYDGWSAEEHMLFLVGLEYYGRGKWKDISNHIVRTKSNSQIASHAQKFFGKGNEKSKPVETNSGKVRKQRSKKHDATIVDDYSLITLYNKGLISLDVIKSIRPNIDVDHAVYIPTARGKP